MTATAPAVRDIDVAARDGERIGLFTAVDRQVTAAIARGVADGLLYDGNRRNRFDTVFAGRYLSALQAWRDGRDPGRSGRLAFRATEDADLGYRRVMPVGPPVHRGERLPTIGEPGGVAAWPEN